MRAIIGFTRWVALIALLLAGCGEPLAPVPGEATPPTPCEEVIEGCSGRRLANVVPRGEATDGALGSIDGQDASGVIGFDDALRAAQANDFRGEARTVRVVLGGADAEELRWGSGGERLFYVVQWGGVELPISGPPGADRQPEFGTWVTVLDAKTGDFVVSGF
jgi:hypothetical protein